MTTEDRPTAPHLPAQRRHDASREIGWYRDPEDPKGHRFWDGREWLDETTRHRESRAS